MIICGQEFEFSALNANDLDRMDAAQQHMQAASDRESKRSHTGTADILRGQCRLMMGYFDELLARVHLNVWAWTETTSAHVSV